MPKVSLNHPLRLPQQPSLSRFPQCLLSPSLYDHLSDHHITLGMTNQLFWKFKIDWGVFKQFTNMPPSQIAAQLYKLCEDSVQSSIVNTNGNFFTLNEQNMTQIIETIVTKYSSPAVHCLSFANLSEGESLQNLINGLIKIYCSGL